MARLISLLETIAVRLAALCIVVIMLIVSTDAIARYLLRAPLPWAFDLISYYLLIAAIYFAISATFRTGDHISIDLFRSLMSPRVRNILDIAWCLMAALAFALIAFGAWEEMSRAYQNRQFLPGYFAWPAWASYPPIVFGSAILVVRLLHHAYILLMHGEDAAVIASGEHVE